MQEAVRVAAVTAVLGSDPPRIPTLSVATQPTDPLPGRIPGSVAAAAPPPPPPPTVTPPITAAQSDAVQSDGGGVDGVPGASVHIDKDAVQRALAAARQELAGGSSSGTEA